MVYIFTNVYRFSSGKDLSDSVERVIAPTSDDTFMFLNECIPLFAAKEYFGKFNIVTLHRRCGSETRWFGYSKTVGSGIKISSILRVDDFGNVLSKDGNTVMKIDFGGYPAGKVPTTGYIAYLLSPKLFGGSPCTFVNFYGFDDQSARKGVSQHDWAFEDAHFRRMRTSNSIFVEPLKTADTPTQPEKPVNPYFYGAAI